MGGGARESPADFYEIFSLGIFSIEYRKLIKNTPRVLCIRIMQIC